MNVCALIPSYDPDERLVSTVKDLQSAGFRHIIVVDDGSRPDCQPYFDALKPPACLVVHLPQNSGKGEALKMGFLTFLTQGWADAGVVTVDGDGQHSGQDALRCARALLRHPHALILGGRDFSGSQVPARSRRGNRAMAALLNRLCGIPLRDTQTGLRAIPASCLPAFSGISGSRYEYETNMLLYCKRHHIPMAEVPISTIYIEDNAGSHYQPVRDSLRIGLILCRCLLTSAAAKDEKLWSRLERSQNAWEETAASILGDGNGTAVMESMGRSFSEIEDVLRGMWILGDAPAAARKYLAELTGSFMSLILDSFFREQGIDSTIMSASEAVRAEVLPHGVILVSGNMYTAPGSVDAAGKNHGDGGSEYTASLIASAHGAAITFWNSRSLLCSAARSDVPSSGVIEHLTYDEATELSFFGAPIIHPQSFLPAVQRSLPISLRYWGDIENKGTLISNDPYPDDQLLAKAFSVNQALTAAH